MGTSAFAATVHGLGTIIAGSVLLAASAFAEAPVPTVKKLAIEEPTHLLFVGNSYLYYGDSVHNHVRRMVYAGNPDLEARTLKYKSATISGSALHDHTIKAYIEPGKLRVKEPFQVVILQGGSAVGWSKKRPPVFKETVADFAAKIRAAGGEPVLYMTQAYVAPHKRTDPGMTDKLNKICTETGNANNALVIPVGLNFAEAYARKPDASFHKSFDGSYPNLHGTILAAATVYGNPVGNPYDYFGKIEAEDLAFLQQVA